MNQKSLNILHINYDWRNIFGTNHEEVVQKFQRDQLNPEFNNFFIISWSHISYDRLAYDNFSSVHLKARLPWFRPLYDFLSLFYVPFIIKRYHFTPDLVLVYDTPLLPTAWLVKKLTKASVVLCLTNLPVEYSRTRKFGFFKSLYSLFFLKIARFFLDYVYTINETVKEYCIEKANISSNKIHIFISNVIQQDITKKSTEPKVSLSLHKLYPINKRKIILSVCRIQPEKGIDRLIKVFGNMQHDDYLLLIIGQTAQQVYRSELENLINRYSLKDHVIFCGVVPREQIWQYYAQADVFVLLSRAEALGLVFWEAMYAGVPVIGSRASGIIESIGDQEDRGFLWDESEGVEVFEKKIHEAICRDELVLKKIKEAKKYIEQKITNSFTINNLFEL